MSTQNRDPTHITSVGRERGAGRHARESLNLLGTPGLCQVWDLPHGEAMGPRDRKAVPAETEQGEAKDGTTGSACFQGKHKPDDAESGKRANQTHSICTHQKVVRTEGDQSRPCGVKCRLSTPGATENRRGQRQVWDSAGRRSRKAGPAV